jgi:anti-sigma factor RsiW
MLTCDEARRVIVHGIDGGLDPAQGALLNTHIKGCTACRFEVRTQELVMAALALWPETPLPAGFAARLSARLDGEQTTEWLGLVNWRAWFMRVLPAAVIVLACAGSFGRLKRIDPRWTEGLERMLARGSVAAALLDHGISGDALIDEAFLGEAKDVDQADRP